MRKALFLLPVALLFIGSFTSCSPTRRLADGASLLVKTTVRVDKNKTSDYLYTEVIQQWPNRKILGWKAYLALYNLGNPSEKKGLDRWFRTIGEAPIVWDSLRTEKTARQLTLVAQNQGYLRAKTSWSVLPGKKRKTQKVEYAVLRGSRFTIGHVGLTVYSLAMEGPAERLVSRGCLLIPGQPFTIGALDAERQRLAIGLREAGFYGLGPELIRLSIDTLKVPGQAQIEILLEDPYVITPNGPMVYPHAVRFLSRIKVDSDFSYSHPFPVYADSVITDGVVYLRKTERFSFWPNRMQTLLVPRVGSHYKESEFTQTTKNLARLSAIQGTEWFFIPRGKDSLDALLRIVKAPTIKSYLRTEGTSTSGLHGIGGSMGLTHNNVLGGAEKIELRLNGALSSQIASGDNQTIFNTSEWGAEVSFSIPRLWLIPLPWYDRMNQTTTELHLASTRQKRPEFDRQTFGLRWIYKGNPTSKSTLLFSPYSVSYIHLANADSSYLQSLLFKTGFQDVLLAGPSLQGMWTSKTGRMQRTVRWQLESAGGALDWVRKTSGIDWPSEDGLFTVFGVPYAHFVRSEIDWRQSWSFREHRQWVVRGLVGAAYTLDNSSGLPPFERSFSAGGSNDLRAWTAYRLGPGAFPAAVYDSLTFVASGPVKLLFSAEYRFPINRALRGALFADAGNTWLLSRNQRTNLGLLSHPTIAPQVVLTPKNVLTQTALGIGFGLRYDFSFFIVRADWGVRVWDPTEAQENRFVLEKFRWQKTALNVGIGYPF